IFPQEKVVSVREEIDPSHGVRQRQRRTGRGTGAGIPHSDLASLRSERRPRCDRPAVGTELGAYDVARRADCARLLTGSRVPQVDAVLLLLVPRPTREQCPTIGAKGGKRQVLRLAQGVEQLAGLRIPEPGCAVLAGRDQSLAIGTEGSVL